VAATAEGGRWRRRCCWWRRWWVAVTASARAGDRARSRGRRAAQARAAGARASLGEGRAARPSPAPFPPATSGRARAPHRSALPLRGACLAALGALLLLSYSRHASGRGADRRAHARSVAHAHSRPPAAESLCLVLGYLPWPPRGRGEAGCRSRRSPMRLSFPPAQRDVPSWRGPERVAHSWLSRRSNPDPEASPARPKYGPGMEIAFPGAAFFFASFPPFLLLANVGAFLNRLY
jgi:hypothetical protein